MDMAGMARSGISRWVLVGGMCWVVGTASAQKDGKGCVPAAAGAKAGAGRCPAGQVPSPDHVPSVAEQFPFPGEAAVPAGHPGAAGGGTPAKDRFPYPGEAVPDAPKGTGAAADRFPYPGGKAGGGTDAGSSSSSSSGGDPAAEGKPGLKDEGSEGEVKPHRRRLRAQAQKTLSDEERVEEDLSVAQFYQKSGNTMGAYLRAKDAVKLQPDAGDTHLALARAAERLGKRDEAGAEYAAALGADLEGDGEKEAKKGLERLKR